MIDITKIAYRMENHVLVVNTTDHELVFQDTNGDLITLGTDPEAVIVTKEEEIEASENGLIVATVYRKINDGDAIINTLKEEAKKAWFGTGYCIIMIGTKVSARAYPEQLFVPIPVSDMKRVPPSESHTNMIKIMRSDKFKVFYADNCEDEE